MPFPVACCSLPPIFAHFASVPPLTTSQVLFALRHSLSWRVSQERNHVCACVLLGTASLGVPLYHMHAAGDGLFAPL